jgi:hypothetical protein
MVTWPYPMCLGRASWSVWQRTFFTSLWTGIRNRDKKGPETRHPQGPTVSDLHSPARSHLLKFPESSKIAPPIWETKTPTYEHLGEITSYPNHNRTQLSSSKTKQNKTFTNAYYSQNIKSTRHQRTPHTNKCPLGLY